VTAAEFSERNSTDCIVAIDPGSDKCGLAIVNRSGEVPFRAVVLTSNMAAELIQIISVYRPLEIIVGNGTGSKSVIASILGAQPTSLLLCLPIRSVPEAYTSEEARARCVKEMKPRGFQRLLPPALRTPSCPYDDYVAVILGERYWRTLIDYPPTPAIDNP
jgi:RNase H-fold protein (predicted Holliday junction resolvase)